MKEKNKLKKIPLGVKILIVFYSLAVLAFIAAAIIAIVFPGLLSNIPNFNLEKFGKNIFLEFASLMIMLAIVFAIMVFGLIKLKNWARLMAIIISILLVIGGILSILEKNFISIINLVVNLIIVLYLLLKRTVKEAFNQKRIESL